MKKGIDKSELLWYNSQALNEREQKQTDLESRRLLKNSSSKRKTSSQKVHKKST